MKRKPSKEALERRRKSLSCEQCGKSLQIEIDKILGEEWRIEHPNQRKRENVECSKCEQVNSYEELREYLKRQYEKLKTGLP